MFKIFAPRVSHRDSNKQNFLATKPIRVRHLWCSLCLIHLLRWRCEGWKLVHNADSFISHSFLTGWQMQRRFKIKIWSTSTETTSQTLTLTPPSKTAVVEIYDSFPPLFAIQNQLLPQSRVNIQCEYCIWPRYAVIIELQDCLALTYSICSHSPFTTIQLLSVDFNSVH